MLVYRISLSFLFAFLISTAGLSAQEGIDFRYISWEEALQAARAERKLVFVDAYTSWCGPCKMMDRISFADKTVGQAFNESFINVKINMEKGEGPQLARDYRVSAYPTLLFINHLGELVYRQVGYKSPEELLTVAEAAAEPERNPALLALQVKEGVPSKETILKYAEYLKEEGRYEEFPALNEAFFADVADKGLLRPEMWKGIQLLTYQINSRECQYLLSKKKKFSQLYGQEVVEHKIYELCRNQIQEAARLQHTAIYEQAIKTATYIDDEGKAAAKLRMVYAEASQNWEEYAYRALDYFATHTTTDAVELHYASTLFYEHVAYPEHLETSISWAKQAIALTNSYEHNATLARLLSKLRRNEEAIRVANKAVYLGRKENKNPQPMITLIRRLRIQSEG